MNTIVEARPVVSRPSAKRICQFIALVWLADNVTKQVFQKTEDKQIKMMLSHAAVRLRTILRRHLKEVIPASREGYDDYVLSLYHGAKDAEFASSLNFDDAVEPSINGLIQMECLEILLQSFKTIREPSIYEVSALIGKLQLLQDMVVLRKKISDMYPDASNTDVPFLFLTGSFA